MVLYPVEYDPPDCPNCGREKLVKHTSAGKGRYRVYPELLVCPSCWYKYDPQPDGTLVRVKNPRRFRR